MEKEQAKAKRVQMTAEDFAKRDNTAVRRSHAECPGDCHFN